MAALVLAACSDEQEFASIPSGGVLTATVEGTSPNTRAGFDAEGAFYWTKGDQLGVTTSANTGSFTALTLADASSGQTSGTFDGTISGEIGSYAVYPYSSSHSISNSTLTYNLPASYTYTKVDTDYFTETKGEGNSFNPAMWGSISNGSTQLKHLGGVFCIKIPKMPVDAGTLTLTADKAITGNFTATLTDGDPVLASTATSSSDNVVNITFSNASTDASGVFYVPVPTGTYTIRIKMMDSSNSTPAKIDAAAGTYVVNRCDLKKVELTEGSIEAEPAENLTAAATDLSSHDNVTVSGEITSTSNEITIPSVTSSETKITKSLALEQVASGASLTIKDTDQSGSGNSVDNLVFSIPNNETENFEPLDLTVTMPNTTVTLAGNGGKAAYGEVTATTAANTLVLSSGVSVEKVIVKKGNIRVNSGAVLTAIERESGNSEKVIIYTEEGVTIPENLDNTVFEVVDASVADLKAVAANGGEYTLQSDITLTEPLVVAKEMTLDLNGHTLKASENGLTKVLNTSDAVVLVRRGAKLTINDSSNGQGSIDYNNVESVYAAVKLTDSNDTGVEAAALVVNNGTLKGYYYGISGNGTRHETTVTVAGGTIQGVEGTGIYHPQDGTLAITGGTITGVDAGVEVRSGTLSVSGSAVISSTAEEFKAEANGNGTTISGAAIAISQHTTDKDLNVTISGGEFNGCYALYETDLQNETGNKTMSITGGTLKGKVYSKNCTEFISGGTFSDPSALSYMTSAANVTLKLAANTTLTESIVVSQGTATIDLNQHTLTAAATAVVQGTTQANASVAIYVDSNATVTVKNGKIGDSTSSLFYGIFGKGSAKVSLADIDFSEMVTYAYNGEGSQLDADDCTIRGWISGWGQGTATFDGCTFTIGKKWYPAAICYGNTTFTNCKFFKNGNDADELGAQGANDNGYYSYNYVVAIARPATTIAFTTCKFIDADNSETVITVNNHPYHACGDWGDGQLPAESQIQVDGSDIQSQCYGFSQESSEGGDVTE